MRKSGAVNQARPLGDDEGRLPIFHTNTTHARTHPTPPPRTHLELRGVEVVGAARELLKVDVRRDVHLAAVDAQDLGF